MKIPTIKRTSAANEVFKVLHEWIISGKLKPGDKLPSQEKLAQQFAVSRNTLREAINKLTAMGLITSKQGVGTVVNISSPVNYMISLTDHLLLDPATVREFLEARVFVEKATVRLAALRATSEDIKQIKLNIDQQMNAFKRGEVDIFSQLDTEFHMALAKASKNKVLLKFLETIWDLLYSFIAEVSNLPNAIEHAVAFHSEIFEFIRSGDVRRAELKIVEHLYDVVQTIESNTDIDLGIDLLFHSEHPDKK